MTGKVCVVHTEVAYRPHLEGRCGAGARGRRVGADVAAAVGPRDPPTSPEHIHCRGGPALKVGLSGSDRQQGLCWIPTFRPLLPQSRLLSPAPERGVRDCTGREGHWLRDRAHNAASQ